MTDAVSALETIRLGLLRLHAGDRNLESLTMELGSATDVAAEIERLSAGQEEVRRLLGQRPARSSGGERTPTPPTPVGAAG